VQAASDIHWKRKQQHKKTIKNKKHMNNLKIIFALIVGVVFGIGFNSLFSGCNNTTSKNFTISTLRPTILQKQVVSTEKKYEQQIDSLKQRSVDLNKSLKNTNQHLEKTKEKNFMLQMQVYDLIDSRKVIEVGEVDETNSLNICDSLQSTVLNLLENSKEKDSLYETVNTNLFAQVQNKDSTILMQENKYIELRKSFDTSITQQQTLYDQNKTLVKHFKRQRIKRKFISVAAIVLAGISANYLIQH
jgi:cell division protein FtsB